MIYGIINKYRMPGRLIALLSGIFILSGLCLVYFNNPTGSHIYPPCIFHKLSGLYCPGCGSGRAVYSLLHLQIGRAVAYNPLLFLYLIVITLWAIMQKTGVSIPKAVKNLIIFFMKPIHVLFIISIFWILRNLPFLPFELLSPDSRYFF